jgi:hypothetical protein
MNNTKVNLAEHCVLVRHTNRCFKPSHVDKGETHSVISRNQAASTAATVLVKPLDKSFYGPIYNHQQRITKFIEFHTVPWGNGNHLLPVVRLEEFTDGIRKLLDELQEVREKQLLLYPDIVANAPRDRMGALFNPKHYPPLEEVRKKYETVVTYSPVPTKDDFRLDITAEQLQMLQTQHEEEVAEVYRKVEQALFTRLAKGLGDCAKALHPDTLRIHDSVFGTLQELIASEPDLNLCGSEEIKRRYREAKAVLLTRTVDNLRDDDALRHTVFKATVDLVASLPGWEEALVESKYDLIRGDVRAVCNPVALQPCTPAVEELPPPPAEIVVPADMAYETVAPEPEEPPLSEEDTSLLAALGL